MRARRFGAIWGKLPLLAAIFGAILGLSTAASSQSQAVRQGVLNVRFGGDARETRVVIEMDRSAHGREKKSDAVRRIAVVELSDILASDDLEGHGQGLVAGWAFDKSMGGARLTMQLTKPAHIARRFLLPPSDGVSAYRYVIDLSADDSAPSVLTAGTLPIRTAPPPNTMPQLTAVADIAPVHLKKVIVIDAGHGGKDPGAQGAISREKDINLAAARALKARLEQTGRYRVVMTRDSDTFVPLETRVQIARRADADLFISLHSDSGPSPDVRGATVYTLSDKGSDRVVRGVMGQNDWFINVDLPGRDRAVNQILLDLTQRATRNRSAAFAGICWITLAIGCS